MTFKSLNLGSGTLDSRLSAVSENYLRGVLGYDWDRHYVCSNTDDSTKMLVIFYAVSLHSIREDHYFLL